MHAVLPGGLQFIAFFQDGTVQLWNTYPSSDEGGNQTMAAPLVEHRIEPSPLDFVYEVQGDRPKTLVVSALSGAE